MEKKNISDKSSKIKNINLDRQFFNINTRGSYNDKKDNKFNEYNQKNNPQYLDRNQFSENLLEIKKKDDKINNMIFAKYQTINKDMHTERINSYLIKKEQVYTSQFDRLIPNKTKEKIDLMPEDTTNINNLFFKNNKKNKKINLKKFNPNIDYSKF
tara:strand:- start:1740 stop:2207 length:468 start_codon:yes stop_codon:yes gene_type:complete